MSGKEPDFTRASARIGLNLIALVGSRFIGMALTLIQMGIIFRALDVEGRGQFGFATNFASLFTVFATLGIQRLLVRDISRDPKSAWALTWTAFAVVVVLSLAVQAGIGASSFWIEDTPADRLSLFFAAIWVVLLWAWQRPFESLLIAHERMDLVAVDAIVGSLFKVGVSYAAMRIAPSSAAAHASIVVGTFVSFLMSVGFSIFVAGWERPRLRLDRALAQVRECYPFAVAMILSQIYFKSDMSLLKCFSGDVETGLYTPPQRVMEPLLMIAGLWGTAVFPALCKFSHAAPEQYAALKKTSIRFALLTAVPMGFGLALLAGPVIDLLTGAAPDARGSIPVLAVLAAVTPFFYLIGVAQEFFYSAHRNWFVVAAYGAGAVFNVAANCAVIPYYGALGAAGVAVATNAIIGAIFVWGLRAEFGAMRLPSLAVRTVGAAVVMSGVVLVLLPYSLVGAIGAGAITFAGAVWLLRALDERERRLLRDVSASAWSRVFRR